MAVYRTGTPALANATESGHIIRQPILCAGRNGPFSLMGTVPFLVKFRR
jgi:hypothetical protein